MSAKTMADVLVDHQRQNAGSCLCGWAKLGHSHPEHQATALAAAGFGLVAEALEEAARDLPYLDRPSNMLVRQQDAAAWLRTRATEMRGDA